MQSLLRMAPQLTAFSMAPSLPREMTFRYDFLILSTFFQEIIIAGFLEQEPYLLCVVKVTRKLLDQIGVY